MKPLMGIPILLTVLVVATIIALPPPRPLPISAYSDETETSKDQDGKQKNSGSGDSFNNNCAESLIDSDTGDDDCQLNNLPRDSESATLTVCKDQVFGSESLEFTFAVTGNNPSAAQFILGDEECVDATIGPGEFTVTENNLSPITRITGDCVQDRNNRLRATGEIQAGETQECNFINDAD